MVENYLRGIFSLARLYASKIIQDQKSTGDAVFHAKAILQLCIKYEACITSARLFMEKGNYKESLDTLKVLFSAFPNHPVGVQIQYLCQSGEMPKSK